MKPYFDDGTVQLFLGDCREVLPALGLRADLIVTDPPFGETALAWDRWVDCWPALAADYARSMWCFGSMRMFLEHRDEFTYAGWDLSQDRIWEKHNGTGFATDRFRRVHEIATHWYRGAWGSIHHDTPREPARFDAKDRTVSASAARLPHTGKIGAHRYEDDGLRLARSVQRAPSVRGGISRTQKPVEILVPLIEYGCPPGGLVLDLFGGSAATAEAAASVGRRAVVVERDEAQIEKAARRLSQGVLDLGGAA